MTKPLFVPRPDRLPTKSRIERPDEIRDVLAVVRLRGGGVRELVIGLDLGRVIRVVGTRDLPSRARKQLAYHEEHRPIVTIRADALYVMDVQAIERQPDAPGADDPLFLYGVVRGPYPEALSTGVAGIEGRLATTRGPLLDGLLGGIERAFVYEHGRCGTSCTNVALPFDAASSQRAVVLAFPLVPMGEDGSNEVVAAQLIHDVLGAMRTDLGDDLATDPVPVPNRTTYENELVAAGWKIKGDVATRRAGRGRGLASLFTPARHQKLPAEASLDDYATLIAKHLARLPSWPNPARSLLRAKLGIGRVRKRTKTQPPPATKPPRGRKRKKAKPRAAPPPPPPPSRRRPRTTARGLTAPKRAEWIRELVEDHVKPSRARPRVTTPARATGSRVPKWMLQLFGHDD